MKNKQTTILILFLLFGFHTKTNAQSGIVTTGGNTSGSGGSTCFSAGQVLYTCFETANGSVSQGVQQAYIVTVPSEIQGLSSLRSNIQIYPNPAATSITLKINKRFSGKIKYQLLNVNGQVLTSSVINNDITEINIKDYASDVYIFKIWNNDKIIESFKIIKQ